MLNIRISELCYSELRAPGCVEATTDTYWGCGLTKNDGGGGECTLPSKWTGWNIFGDLLTAVREEMMIDPNYEGEIQQMVDAREQKLSVSKRHQNFSPSEVSVNKHLCLDNG